MAVAKVGRVASVAEVVELEALGADLIGLSLTADPRFTDDRIVTVEQAAAIGRALHHAAFFQADVLSEYRDSWAFLFPGAVQVLQAAAGR